MIINMRYYVVTIVAIFAAIGLGILIGFNLNSQDLYQSQQQIVLESMEARFNELSIENQFFLTQVESLLNENKQNQELIETLYQDIVKDQLSGLNIAVLITSPNYYYGDLKETLEEAGAHVPIEVQLTHKNMTTKSMAINAGNGIELEVFQGANLQQTINGEIERLLALGHETSLLKELADKGYLSYRYDPTLLKDMPIHHVIIAGGASINEEEKARALDQDLVRRLHANVIPVTAVERREVTYSYQSIFNEMNVELIESINLTQGKILLIQELRRTE